MSSITVKKCDMCGAIEEAEKPMPYTHERYLPPHETDFTRSIQTGHAVDVCASQWHNRGVAVLPIRSGSKRAAIAWKTYQITPPTKSQVTKWFTNQCFNLGLLCGAVSGGLVVLDFDQARQYLLWSRTYPKLNKSYTVRTPRGYHVYLYADDLSGDFDVPFDLKRSGYVLCPPSRVEGYLYQVVSYAPILHVDSLRGVLGEYFVEPARGRATPNKGSVDHFSQSCMERDVIREIKANLPIMELLSEYVELRPSDPTGRYWLCRCPMPWHEDEHPSFWADAEVGRCSCFVPWCRAKFGGRALDVVSLFARLEGLTLKQSVAQLAQRLNL